MKQVLVFKTSVTTKAEVTTLKPVLDRLVAQEGRWNFDLDDEENILRIEAPVCRPTEVIEALRKTAHFCEELAD